MSFTKELLFGDNPRHDESRQQLHDLTSAKIAQFPERIRGKRKEADGRWSPHWELSVRQAAEELGIQLILVNSRFAFRTTNDKKAVAGRAEIIWQEKIGEHRKWLESSSAGPVK
ncbi:hypothetical protein [Rhizobium sp. 007]|uniref:hypothetical protein n=1 Tax=Rhizobium sp. 007 TaxID=2785056 RepID=UPI00188F4F4E|nr:hypothetical protein [Rhizobium sp. 007]QPB24342.1 hypothetical protein ISN39_32840 [Rhizobium sp. 007]